MLNKCIDWSCNWSCNGNVCRRTRTEHWWLRWVRSSRPRRRRRRQQRGQRTAAVREWRPMSHKRHPLASTPVICVDACSRVATPLSLTAYVFQHILPLCLHLHTYQGWKKRFLEKLVLVLEGFLGFKDNHLFRFRVLHISVSELGARMGCTNIRERSVLWRIDLGPTDTAAYRYNSRSNFRKLQLYRTTG